MLSPSFIILKIWYNNPPFIEWWLLLAETGNINAKLWDLKDDYNDEFKENTLVKVKG